jgi:5-methyltetrahydrofolate--homocysteine methyltransferase
VPNQPGVQVLKAYDLAQLVELHRLDALLRRLGTARQVSEDPRRRSGRRRGDQALLDAQAMLKKMIAENWIEARAVFGLFPANTVNDDDIEIYVDESRKKMLMTWHNLRQQMKKPEGRANLCLADFVAPREDSGVKDYLGAFVVTAGIGEDERARPSRPRTTITRRSSSSRCATASPRPLPSICICACAASSGATPVRKRSANDELIAEKYQGIRPAPGYPACPEHSEKAPAVRPARCPPDRRQADRELRHVARCRGVGFYLSHPDSQYFAVAKIERDQVEDYARRKGWTLAEAERWLAPNLAYTPGVNWTRVSSLAAS